MKKFCYLLLISLLLQFGCGDSNKKKTSAKESEDREDTSWKLEDGDYCADVMYYNPRTGHKASYDLTVEIVNNTPTKIYFCNGGYLDDFNSLELSENLQSSFTMDDGRQFDLDVSNQLCDEKENCNDASSSTYSYEFCCEFLNLSQAEKDELEKHMSFTKGDLVSGRKLENLREYLKSMRAIQSIKSESNNGKVMHIQKLAWRDGIHCQVIILKKHGRFYLCNVSGNVECIMGTLDFNENDTDWQNVIIKNDFEGNLMKGYAVKVLETDRDFEYLKRRLNVYCHY
jgi:hypothetical protein